MRDVTKRPLQEKDIPVPIPEKLRAIRFWKDAEHSKNYPKVSFDHPSDIFRIEFDDHWNITTPGVITGKMDHIRTFYRHGRPWKLSLVRERGSKYFYSIGCQVYAPASLRLFVRQSECRDVCILRVYPGKLSKAAKDWMEAVATAFNQMDDPPFFVNTAEEEANERAMAEAEERADQAMRKACPLIGKLEEYFSSSVEIESDNDPDGPEITASMRTDGLEFSGIGVDIKSAVEGIRVEMVDYFSGMVRDLEGMK